MVDSIALEALQDSPETAERLGVPESLYGGPYHELLDDRSIAAVERRRISRLEHAEALREMQIRPLSPEAGREVSSVSQQFDAATDLDRYAIGYVRIGWASPYLINHLDGAYTDLVRLMTQKHPVRSRADADSWLARLRKVAPAMRDDLRNLEVDLRNGVIPPRDELNRTLERIRSLTPVRPREHPAYIQFADSLADVSELTHDEIVRLQDEAAVILANDLRPAYDELARTLQDVADKAPEEPGVWRQPNGEEYYRSALRLYTGTARTPQEIADIGRGVIADVTAEMDTLLASQGYAEGSVAERMTALSSAPDYLLPDSLEGVSDLFAALREHQIWGEDNLARISNFKPRALTDTRLVPKAARRASGGAYYRPAAMDGSKPATFNVNVVSPLEWPTWSLPTLTFHETIPGHHLQVEAARASTDGALWNAIWTVSGFNEGWALYAEDLANELGAYRNNPVGRLGYLQAVLLRAARAVADVGVHSERWTRQEAVDYLVATVGISTAQAEREVDRFTIWPGHACSYIVGREEIRRLRGMADRELGPQFDLVAFNDVVLSGGSRPLEIVGRDVRAWIEAQKASAPAVEK
ncbi:MAG: DUF885 domain-containing protein [Hyphomonadaceae bacterium]